MKKENSDPTKTCPFYEVLRCHIKDAIVEALDVFNRVLREDRKLSLEF